ncbi:hypothetical protein FRC03_012246 [Tulasnella sp. 419]|nr:hypothetical protein FRC03_012246 [Tulasnella sp. 419]
MSQTIDIPQELKSSLRKFRFARHKGNAAFIAKVNKQKLIIEEVEVLKEITIEDLVEELPESSPRYIVLSYDLTHPDGRKSNPLLLINWTPEGSETSIVTLHASAFILFQDIADANKTLEVRDGQDGLTQRVVENKLLA